MPSVLESGAQAQGVLEAPEVRLALTAAAFKAVTGYEDLLFAVYQQPGQPELEVSGLVPADRNPYALFQDEAGDPRDDVVMWVSTRVRGDEHYTVPLVPDLAFHDEELDVASHGLVGAVLGGPLHTERRSLQLFRHTDPGATADYLELAGRYPQAEDIRRAMLQSGFSLARLTYIPAAGEYRFLPNAVARLFSS